MTARDLKLAIHTLLKSKHPRVYYQTAPSKAKFPYIIHDLPNAIDSGEPPEVWVLDVDGWDQGGESGGLDESGDSGALDALMELVDAELHRKTLFVSDARVQIYRDMRLAPVTEENDRLKRRRYTYQVRVYQ